MLGHGSKANFGLSMIFKSFNFKSLRPDASLMAKTERLKLVRAPSKKMLGLKYVRLITPPGWTLLSSVLRYPPYFSEVVFAS